MQASVAQPLPAAAPESTSANTRVESRTAWLPELDGFRALAGIVVVMHHAYPAWFQTVAAANTGVALFFSLSGFLIYLLAIREYEQHGRLNIRRFYLRRILRIWPLYFAVIVGCLAVFGVPGLLSDPGPLTGMTTLDYLARYGYAMPIFLINVVYSLNYVAAPFWGSFWFAPAYLLVMWSITVEEQFYLVFPALFLLAMRWTTKRWHLVVLLLGLGLALRVGFVALPLAFPTDEEVAAGPELRYFQMRPPTEPPDVRDVRNRGGLYYSTVAYTDIFILGAVAGHFYHVRGGRGREHWGAMVALFLGSAAAIGYLMFLWQPLLWAPYTTSSVLIYTLLAVPMATLIYATVSHPQAPWSVFLRAYPVRVLGFLSYGIYLLHISVIRLVGRWHGGLTPVVDLGKDGATVIYLLYLLAATIALAAILHAVVERPFLLLKQRRRAPTSGLSSTTVPWLPTLLIALTVMAALDWVYWRAF